LYRAAGLAERQKDLDAARALSQESLDLARAIGDAHAIGKSLLGLGIVEGDVGNFELSEALQREALSVFSKAESEREVREVLGMLGFLYISHGDYERATSVCERALSMSRTAGDNRGIALAASNLGHAFARQGKTLEALELQREALVLANEMVDLQGTGEILLDIAALAVTSRDYVTAGRLLGAITALAETAEFALMPVEVEWFEESLDKVRGALGRDNSDRTLAEGRSMRLDDVVAYSVEFIDSAV
jgi:tetratricopeptide (TPR) repeat protein